MAKASSFICGAEGFEIYINYNQSNLRINSVDWTIPINVIATAIIWDNDVEIYHNTITGSSIGGSNIAGNYRMVNTPEGPDLPPEISLLFYAQVTV